MRILILLDLLTAVRKCQHEFEIVTIDLAADLVQQLGGVAFEKPEH
ncbi:MAG TPA: hypothetical protein VGI12_10315 [Vicinamibacterales bacterium]